MRGVILAAITLAIACSGCRPGESEFKSLCEAKLAERLRFPATYRLIDSSTPKGKAIHWKELSNKKVEAGQSVSKLERMIVDQIDLPTSPYRSHYPKMFDIEIKYESKNGFGVSIRSKAVCRHFALIGNLSDISKHSDVSVVSDREF